MERDALAAEDAALAGMALEQTRTPAFAIDVLCRSCVDVGAQWAGAIVGARRAFASRPGHPLRSLARALSADPARRIAMAEIVHDGVARAFGDGVMVFPLVASGAVHGALCVLVGGRELGSRCLELAIRAGAVLDVIEERAPTAAHAAGRITSVAEECAAGARRIALATGLSCIVHLRSEDGGWLLPSGLHAPSAARFPWGEEPISTRDPVYGAVLEDAKPRGSARVAQPALDGIRTVVDPSLPADVGSLIVLPLSNVRPIGTVTLVRPASAVFVAQSTVWLVSRLCDELAVRVERARTAAVEGRTAAIRGRLARLQRVNTALADATRLDDVADAILLHALPALGAAGSAVDLGEGFVRCVGARPDVLRRLLDEARTLVDAEWRSVDTRDDDETAVVLVPIRSGERHLGAIAAAFANGGPSADEQRVIRTIARQCAHAIERVTLRAAEVRASERLARVADATALLASSIDWDETLEHVGQVFVPQFAEGVALDLHVEGATERVFERGRCEGAPVQLVLENGGRALGRLTLHAQDSTAVAADRLVLDELVRRAAIAIEHAHLHRRLGEALRVRDDFLTAAGHELRTPLTTLRMCLWSMNTLGANNAISPELAMRQLGRLEQLVEHLLDVRHLAERRLPLDREEVDLVHIVREVVQLGLSDPSTPIHIRAEDSVRGRWDPFRISQVVTNVVGNAAKYGAGRPVEVVIEADGDRARLRVRDRGIGIPDAARGRVFDRFERAAPGHPGLGLGLWISREIVHAHGGSIEIASNSDGEGTEFVVELPRG